MTHTLPELELKRSELLRQIASLGDFRSGSITSIRGRCGKPNCHCHKPNHPGHGPNFRLTRKRKGKTVSETFPSSAAFEKAQREVAKEVDTLLRLVFAERCKTGQLDLEAVEMALRAALHRAGAAALTELLRTTAPVEMTVCCRCGHAARYHQMRRQQLLTVLGRLELERAY
jgi:hypothetical protein